VLVQGGRVNPGQVGGAADGVREGVGLADQRPVELEELLEADGADPVPHLVVPEQRQAPDLGGGVLDGSRDAISAAQRLHHARRGERLLAGGWRHPLEPPLAVQRPQPGGRVAEALAGALPDEQVIGA